MLGHSNELPGQPNDRLSPEPQWLAAKSRLSRHVHWMLSGEFYPVNSIRVSRDFNEESSVKILWLSERSPNTLLQRSTPAQAGVTSRMTSRLEWLVESLPLNARIQIKLMRKCETKSVDQCGRAVVCFHSTFARSASVFAFWIRRSWIRRSRIRSSRNKRIKLFRIRSDFSCLWICLLKLIAVPVSRRPKLTLSQLLGKGTVCLRNLVFVWFVRFVCVPTFGLQTTRPIVYLLGSL